MSLDSFYSLDELRTFGFGALGSDVRISRKCSIYNAEQIHIGNHVRIDDFCILSGKITLRSYIHISAYCALYGRFGITLGDFCGLSPRTTVFSASDDFSGRALISPMVPEEFISLTVGAVTLDDFCQVGADSVLMPGVTLKEGAVCGAFSFVNTSLDAWTINAGIPCALLKARHKTAKVLGEIVKSAKSLDNKGKIKIRGGGRSHLLTSATRAFFNFKDSRNGFLFTQSPFRESFLSCRSDSVS